MKTNELKIFLDKKVKHYNQVSFIEHDPICIPHQFTTKQDIEISGFFAAIFAWGQRTTIINKSNDLMQRMSQSPHDFVLHHSAKDLKSLVGFKHRTFNDVDLLFLIDFLHQHYKKHESLEDAFLINNSTKKETNPHIIQEDRLRKFYNYVFSHEHLKRTQKHIATPAKKSACKRLNMYLRWMVRQDTTGVDFGIWKRMKPSELVIPLDVHVLRISEQLGLLKKQQTNWALAVKLTEQLRQFDPRDPVKYDFALFGIGVTEK